ncbi:choice-of-anchor tandem repeat GloVer-containing protein [Chryseolinea sp. T2]|uniref:choice-of-anchor tandem repeat GloVer-containing protein n=1 Tax=Chryseolinea sp. T2 TaxID=3129255 RepID=UPI003077365E
MNTLRNLVLGCLLLSAQSGICQDKILGMTATGGEHDYGVIYTTNADGSNYQVIHHFDSINGSLPESKMLKAPNGKLYGITHSGGRHNGGVIFEIDQNGAYHKKTELEYYATGSGAMGGLTWAPNGKLYGAAWSGGVNHDGTIFEYDIVTNRLRKVADFSNEALSTGVFPFGSLVLAYDGKLYGTGYEGGKYTLGVIFEVDPNKGTLTKRYDLDFVTGNRPPFSLTLATDGKLYGMAGGGGEYGFGTIFAFDPATGNCEKLHDFDGPKTGSNPLGTLTLGYDGKLYGTTSWGGQYNDGVIFEFDYHTRTLVTRFEFDSNSNTGKAPRGGLLQSSNGKFYGTTEQGGTTSQGVLFEFDPHTDAFAIKRDFSRPSGGMPQSCELILVRNRDDRAFQAIQFEPFEKVSLEEKQIKMPPTATSGLPITYYSSDPDIASVSENVLSLNSTGTITITATQSGNASFQPAPDIARVITVDNESRTNLITGAGVYDASFNVVLRENPFHGTLKLQVNSPRQTSASITLYTITGQRIHEATAETNAPVELQTNASPGLYLLDVQSPHGRKVLKVFCQNP